MTETSKIAIVTGANRGIGFETCRQLAKRELKVILTSRDRTKGTNAAKTLQSEGLDVIAYPLDVTQPDSIQQLKQFVEGEFHRLEVLVNNAGIFPDMARPGNHSAFDTPIDTVRDAMETNVYGPLQLLQTLIPLMKQNGYGRIVNLSSGMGQLSDMNGGYPGYRLSKTALNALTRIFADELKGTNILINSVCPGWVRTDMGGANAPRHPEQGAETVVWLATLPKGGPTGGFFRDKQPIAW